MLGGAVEGDLLSCPSQAHYLIAHNYCARHFPDWAEKPSIAENCSKNFFNAPQQGFGSPIWGDAAKLQTVGNRPDY